ncbi:MAG: hypothetical protein A3F47_00150 [Candidatus Staskawiczbacteria bacterium RIFCSPHIGHO2_12_FULL_38_11]|uniref:Uncharacterized protein n=1 Tax=Candidatus Staskawiczbacteria bacterium RIFCSPHIGHO2_12_FULL_38_11 TaxID=1802209 RepID=A0A1G2I749_9BACT|nr:MAG: hypothetical protein A3F47_00150 [Candidatus Staskawiczbacteria bacterium RIFCSPHIGHO2_12_FULL_38_11]
MSYAIVSHILDGFHGQWKLKEVRAPFESFDVAEKKLREWGYSKQQGYELYDVQDVWLRVQEHVRNVPKDQPQYFIMKAQICEIQPG